MMNMKKMSRRELDRGRNRNKPAPDQASQEKECNGCLECEDCLKIMHPPADVEDEWRCGLLRLCSDIYGSFHWHPKMESFIRSLLKSERKKWAKDMEALIEQAIQDERYSGTPTALNELKKLFNKNL